MKCELVVKNLGHPTESGWCALQSLSCAHHTKLEIQCDGLKIPPTWNFVHESSCAYSSKPSSYPSLDCSSSLLNLLLQFTTWFYSHGWSAAAITIILWLAALVKNGVMSLPAAEWTPKCKWDGKVLQVARNSVGAWKMRTSRVPVESRTCLFSVL